ncbi:type II toxin-antitoxin system Phd/YefM family antitoxin [Candidatus Electrothrix sp.]|uniref:type II toxin-antitoxin system Phd/YefM family antitoxin n=1 Tax=Candidatus Electrothrix sp. TaxID=2170559 RepID=UPI004057802D
MIIVNTHEAKTNLSKLLTLVAEKHEIIKICRNGKVMAELVKPKSGKASPGKLPVIPELTGVVFKEPVEAPLPEEFFPDYTL